MGSSMRRLVVSVALVTTFTGCCTDMGCGGTLEIRVGGDVPDGAFTAEVDFDGATDTCAIAADGVADCGDGVLSVAFEGADLVLSRTTGMTAVPDDVTVRILDDEGGVVLEETVSPDWGDPFYPNGRVCDVEGCSSGTAAVTI